jgi:hypothetical protein
LTLYLAVMFGVRELYIADLGFMANALLMSLVTLIVASWRMRARRISWRALDLRKPERFTKTLVAMVAILAMAIGGIVFFELIKDAVFPGLEADDSSEAAKSKFGDLTGDSLLLLTLLPVFWLESMLEELLDRGFLMNWLE